MHDPQAPPEKPHVPSSACAYRPPEFRGQSVPVAVLPADIVTEVPPGMVATGVHVAGFSVKKAVPVPVGLAAVKEGTVVRFPRFVKYEPLDQVTTVALVTVGNRFVLSGRQ